MKSVATRNPYICDGCAPKLQRSVFAFVDVLGYKDWVKKTKGRANQESLLLRLHNALSSSRDWLDGGNLPDFIQKFGDRDRFSLKAFTDNIAVGWPIGFRRGDGEGELISALHDLATFQLKMVQAGFFIRGAVAVGDIYVDEIAVYGDALVDAHKGESKLAKDPRIVLTESAKDVLQGYLDTPSISGGAQRSRGVWQDNDGQWFVNYLDTILIAEDQVGPFFSELKQHKGSVQSKLEEYGHDAAIFAKYAWTAGYHNDFCDFHGFEARHKIDSDVFASQRGPIINRD
ncbi:MAG: hypothetical protein F4053_10300 [Proteobacteria bacterium]|nr:hypothetical protein [Pseudomonadota bacterium]